MDKKKIIIAAVLGAVLLGGGLFTGITLLSGKGDGASQEAAPSDEMTRAETIRQNKLLLAEDYLEQQEFQRALDLLDELLIEDAQDSEARTLRNQVIDAKKAYEQSLASEKDEKDEELQETLDQLGSSLQQQPDAGRDDEERRRREQELAELEARLREAELKKQEEAARQAAMAEEERRRMEKIEELLEAGTSLAQRGDYIGARGKWQEALELDPESSRALALIGESYLLEDSDSEENREKAADYSNRAIRADEGEWLAYYTLGRIAAQRENWSSAVRDMETAAGLNPRNSGLYFDLGKAQYREERYSDARDSFETCIYLDAEHSRAYYNLGAAHIKLRKYDSAYNAYERAFTIDPSYAAAFNAAAMIKKAKKEYAAAEKLLKKALALEPESPAYSRQIGFVLFRQEKYQAAREAFAASLEQDPDRADTNYNMALTLQRLERHGEALEYAVKAIQEKGTEPAYYFTLGEICEGLDRLDTAVEAYENAIKLDPRYLKPRINVGKIYDEQGRSDKALENLIAAYRMAPDSLEVNNNLGNAYLHAELYEDSITHYRKALQLNQKDPLLLYNLSIAYIETDNLSAAKENLDKLIKIKPDFWDAYYRLGNILYTEGDKESAREIFKALLDKNPEYSRRAELEPLING